MSDLWDGAGFLLNTLIRETRGLRVIGYVERVMHRIFVDRNNAVRGDGNMDTRLFDVFLTDGGLSDENGRIEITVCEHGALGPYPDIVIETEPESVDAMFQRAGYSFDRYPEPVD